MTRGQLRLFDSLYSSLLDDPPWVAFLDELERQLPCHHSTMVLRKPRDGDPGVLICASRDREAVLALQQREYRDSPFMDLPEGKVCTLGEVMSMKELRKRHPGFHDYLNRYSATTDLIGVDLLDPDTGMTFRLRGARLAGEPAFGARDRKLLELLLSRLRTAIALYARIALQQYQMSVLDQTAGQLAIASMVLDEHGELLVKNLVADRVLQQCDGFCLQDGMLRCVDGQSQRALRRALSTIVAGTADCDRSLQVRRAGEGRYWSVLLRPARAQPGLDEKVSATVVVLVRDASIKPQISVDTLIELFGLTRAESALAVRLVKGESLNDAAQALGISRFTARAQLASIFARTGVHRQPQLVAHILGTLNTAWT